MNIYLKEITIEDDKRYCDLLIELSRYKDVYARPVPDDFEYSDYEHFKKARVSMFTRDNNPVNTYWIMDNDNPIGYATLRRDIDITKPGGHLGCCLKKEYQNKGVGTIVANLLSEIAYSEYDIKELIYTSKNENIQSQKSIEKLGGIFIDSHDGYKFYKVDLVKKYEERRKKIW